MIAQSRFSRFGFVPGIFTRPSRTARCVAVGAGLCLALLVSGAAPASAADCASLTGLALKDTTITSATVVPAAGMLPEYCKVLGRIHNLPNSIIRFEVSLPTTRWNGKYFVAGGGGFNGVIPRLDQALARGYAAAGSDTGHEVSNTLWALNNLDAQNNYGYLATHVVTLAGKQIVREFYGVPERRSYFVGCSNGGKMALAEAQRYPEDFDGIIAGNPVIDRSRLMMQYTLNAQALAAAPIPPSKIPLIEKATMNACRESGGAINGVLMNPGRCRFDPKVLLCPAGDGVNCLTAAQVQALQKVMNGPVNAAGVQVHPGFPPGHEEDYASYITGDGNANSSPSSSWVFQDTFMRQFIFGMNFNPVKDFSVDRHLVALKPVAAAQDSANPDLSKFKARGGKLILYHGWADHSITPIRTIQYYAEVIRTMGIDQKPGEEDADQVAHFARLFMAPGMHHCANGPGPNVFGGANQGLPLERDAQHDIVMALDRWVEDGIAPEKIIASHLTDGRVDRTLPLCPYPQAPVFNGSGDVRMAESYHCEDRSFGWALEGVERSARGPGVGPARPATRSRSRQ